MSGNQASCSVRLLRKQSFTENILCYCTVCWYGHFKITHRNKLGKIVHSFWKLMGRQSTDLYHHLTRLADKAARSAWTQLNHSQWSFSHSIQVEGLCTLGSKPTRKKLIYSHGCNVNKQDAVAT